MKKQPKQEPNMKKIIIPVAVILAILSLMLLNAGLKLNSLSNSLAETENAIQELKRRAAADSIKVAQAKAEHIKKDTLTFGEEMVTVKFLLNDLPDVVSDVENIPHMEVAYNNGSDIRYGQTLISYDEGMPKIVVYWFESKADKKMHRLPFMYFLDNDGTVIAHQINLTSDGRTWMCDTPSVDGNTTKRFFFKDPNLCRNIAKGN